MADNRARIHDPAHSAAQNIRPGLFVHPGRPHRRQHGHGLLHSPGSLPAQQGRPWRRFRRRSVRGDRAPVRSTVPAPARARAHMSASVQGVEMVAPRAAGRLARLNRLDVAGLLITFGTLIGAIIWAFPLYWGLITTFK